MGHSKKPRRGRSHHAQAEALFQRALLGESSSKGRGFNPREDRKTLQLCRQVQRAIAMALGGECADDLLTDAYVESVEPMGSSGQLLVRVTVPGDGSIHPAEVMARLGAHTPRLRAVVASEICRKRVPALSFVVVPVVARHPPNKEHDSPDSARTPQQSGTRDERSAAADLDAPDRRYIRGGASSQCSPAVPRLEGEEGGDHED